MIGLKNLFHHLSGQVVGIRPVTISPPPPDRSPALDPPGSGTYTGPFHSITVGMAASNGRHPIYLRGRQYHEPIVVTGVEGPSDRKDTISSHRNEPVIVDCIVPIFQNPIADAHWQPTENGPDEFIWSVSFPDGEAEEVGLGAFLSTHQHTRLITYNHLEDLRSLNELDIRTEDPRPLEEIDPNEPVPVDNRVWTADPAPGPRRRITTGGPREFRNRIYMDPGIWFDTEERRLHIRLSHTHNSNRGWPDYEGIADERRVRLAPSKTPTLDLSLRACKHLRYNGINLSFGGRETLLLRNCEDIEFDHVSVRAGSRALRLEAGAAENNERIVFHGCQTDGGMPIWLYRSDRMDQSAVMPSPMSVEMKIEAGASVSITGVADMQRTADYLQTVRR